MPRPAGRKCGRNRKEHLRQLLQISLRPFIVTVQTHVSFVFESDLVVSSHHSMAIKDLFRKRSKSRVRSGGSEYQSRSTTPTPGATLANAGGSPTSPQNGGAGYQNSSSPSYDRNSMNNPRSRASADVLDQTALPYRQQPAGEPPSRGATPLPGNATSDSDRTRARSIGGGRSVDLNRPSQAAPSSAYTGTTTTTGSSGTPGNFTTTTTTTTTTGSRPTSRSGTRHGAQLYV